MTSSLSKYEGKLPSPFNFFIQGHFHSILFYVPNPYSHLKPYLLNPGLRQHTALKKREWKKWGKERLMIAVGGGKILQHYQ